VAGEIYIGGVGVARGYLHRPELTAERFLKDPFVSEPGVRMYRTGDLARWLPDGNIEFVGRNDYQVKIRGFRIELGEIETRLSRHPAIREAAVIAHEEEGDKRLLSFYVPKVGEHDEPDADVLRVFLSESLPDYMVPAVLVRLDSLPLTPNGKLDRKALLALSTDDRSILGDEEPQGETEITLATLFAEVLRLDKVGRNGDFFELGGHSILAVQLMSRVQQSFQVELELSDLFDHPTLKEVAEIIVTLQLEGFNAEDLEPALKLMQSSE
jgi:syringomycin synthetase protein SyrE